MIYIFFLCKYYVKGGKIYYKYFFFLYCIKIVLNFKKIKDFLKIIKLDIININKLILGGFFFYYY